jgi:hypothetical protein
VAYSEASCTGIKKLGKSRSFYKQKRHPNNSYFGVFC